MQKHLSDGTKNQKKQKWIWITNHLLRLTKAFQMQMYQSFINMKQHSSCLKTLNLYGSWIFNL
jgi:hypothetical protein